MTTARKIRSSRAQLPQSLQLGSGRMRRQSLGLGPRHYHPYDDGLDLAP